MPVKTKHPVRYSLDVIRDEAYHLVRQGMISRQQPIYALWQYIPASAWNYLESELEQDGYLLRDRVGDLFSQERWDDD